jgi:putative transposase
LPKQQWLAERKIDAEWPVHGIFSRLHLDNAKEFRSEALRRGCEQYGIAIDYRPVRTPHYGGHIERLIGTMMGKVHLLPGTTFSNIAARGDVNPEKSAAMTIDELDRWLGHAIAGAYHETVHRTLDRTPLAAWHRGVRGDATTAGCGEPAAVSDPRRFLIDFLPIERRLIRREGVALNSIHYWSDVLTSWVGEPHPMIVRYDPRDLSRIYLLGPDGQYYDLAYRDLRRPPISLWEQRLALKRLREERHSHIDEGAIFRTVENMRQIVDEAVVASKQARRQRERRLRLITGGKDEADRAAPSDGPTLIEESSPGQQPYEDMLPVEEWT